MTADQKVREAYVALEEASRAMRRLETHCRIAAVRWVEVGHLRNEVERAQLRLGDLRLELEGGLARVQDEVPEHTAA
jgi:hypothetical protein